MLRTLLIVLCLFPSGNASAAGSSPRKDATQLLRQKCVQCHGGQKTKGQMNLAGLLQRKFSFDDVEDWSRVFAEIQSGNMPPEDADKALLPKEEKIILQALLDKLGQGNHGQTRRMLTPDEFKNSITDLFQIDLQNYDPYGDLHAYISPEHKFLTVDSSRLMNRFYLKALMDGTERILREYQSGNQPVPGKARGPQMTAKQKETRERRKAQARQRYEDLKTELLKDGSLSDDDHRLLEQRKYDSLQGRLEGEIARRTPKSKNYTSTMRFPMKMSPKIKDTTDGFFEYADDHWGIRGKSWIGNNNMPIMLLGGYGQQFRILPPGRYRLTLRATATDRDTISNVPDIQSEETAWSNQDRLESELCKLTVFKDANRTKTRSDPLTRATPIGAFYIEDGVIKDYTLDVSFHWNTQLGVLFENGVANVIQAAGRHPIMDFDENDEVVYARAEKKLPTIRIYDVTLEKIGDVPRGELYVRDIDSFDDDEAREKVRAFASLAGLGESRKFEQFYESLSRAGDEPFDAYVATLKWLFATSDFLYLDPTSSNLPDRLRHASYSLLKTVPSPTFKQAFAKYAQGEIDAATFTDIVVSDPRFKKFTRSFAHQWLELSEISQNAPDRAKFAPFYDDNLQAEFEQESAAYLHHLFVENRKLIELVDSDFQFVSDELAVLYGIENVRHNDVRKVPARRPSRQLGILSQAGLMTAQANGVEDLPFRRAKWISENILDKKIPPPPDEIDVAEFGRTENKDFASRIEAHKSSPDCRTCHRLIDPIAIDMEMFDVLGRLKRDAFTPAQIDAHVKSLQKTITSSERKIASAFAKNLHTFITGRKPGIRDLQQIDQILDKAKAEGYRAKNILAAIIAQGL